MTSTSTRIGAPIIHCIMNGDLPQDTKEASKIKKEILLLHRIQNHPLQTRILHSTNQVRKNYREQDLSSLQCNKM